MKKKGINIYLVGLALTTILSISSNKLKNSINNVSFETVKEDTYNSISNENNNEEIVIKNEENNENEISENFEDDEKIVSDIIINKLAYVKEDTEILLDNGEIKTIEKYQSVFVLNSQNGTLNIITFDNELAYIDEKNIEYLPDTFVEVDISSQTVKLYLEGELYLETKTVTGHPKTPTYEGYFKIGNKQRNIYLTGPTWKSYVKYWMQFDSGRGLHDASWRSDNEFENSETYLTNGSHGCVNLPVDIAPQIYENVNIGTRVLVHK